MKLGDAAFLVTEKPTRGSQVSMLTRWSLPPDAKDDFLTKLVDRWRNCRDFAEPFNLRLKAGLVPAWETLRSDQIDLDYHFRHSALPKPGGERELGVLASQLHSTPLDRHRPLWEMHVIEGLENDEFAIFLKLHHAQIDGMGAIQLLERVLSPRPEARDMPAFWEVAPKDSAPGSSRWFRLPKPSDLRRISEVGSLTKAVFDLQTSRDRDNASAFDAPKTVFNQRLQAPRRIATQCFEVKRMSRLAKKAGVSMNDVALSISASALRTYLIEHSELPDKSLTAGVPVSMRENDDVGNAISFIIAKLHTDIADPLDRLHAIHHSTTLAKERYKKLPSRETREAFGTLIMAPYFGQVALNLSDRAAPVFNLIISNVPGPPDFLYLEGARMEVFYPISAVLDGQALNITFLSYAGRYGVGFTSCREAVPHMQRIAVATGEALDELEHALEQRTATPNGPVKPLGQAAT
ncbi:MAG TPA: wax ester/triacylglycerol synthase family O-acyltransferase [Pseudonocardia sp.]|jgi:WS/DGAT/MGAT family acyltransferase|nr:wax ester/triacylglycerol synthase family O-acyltransferase [Pseudonocardia sp.]